MSIQRIHLGPRMSQTVIHNNTIYLSGQIGQGEDITAQSKDMLTNVDTLLQEVGSNKSKILSATIWLSDMANFDAMNKVWESWIDPQNPPTRACGQSQLASPSLLIEVIVVATND